MQLRYFELISSDVTRAGRHTSKFWEVSTDGPLLTVRYGKLGAQGRSKTTVYSSAPAAQETAERLVTTKIAKGYVEASNSRHATDSSPSTQTQDAYEVGDFGPGGGIVFYDAGSDQPWGRYLEFAPSGWSQWGWYSPNVPFVTPSPAGLSTALGSGRENTDTLLGRANSATGSADHRALAVDSSPAVRMHIASDPKCPGDVLLLLATDRSVSVRAVALANPSSTPEHHAAAYLVDGVNSDVRRQIEITRNDVADESPYDAAVLAAMYRGGGLNDWFLPSEKELQELKAFWDEYRVGGFGEDWSPEERLAGMTYWSSSTDGEGAPFTVALEFDVDPPDYAYVRPVRAFTGVKPPRQRGQWRVGDVGLAGGIIVYEDWLPAGDHRYLEVAPPGWAGTAKDPWGVFVLEPDGLGPFLDGTGIDNTAGLLTEAAHPATPPQRLTQLAESEDEVTRAEVAANPATPQDVLAQLAHDDEGLVRAAVIANPKVSSTVRATAKRGGVEVNLAPLGAALTAAYRGGGAADWFLPSMDELAHLYTYWSLGKGPDLRLVKGAAYLSSSNREEYGGEFRYMSRQQEPKGYTGELDYDGTGFGLARIRPMRWCGSTTT